MAIHILLLREQCRKHRIFVPRFHQTPDQFAVTLECRDAGMRFYAEYQIPSSDCKEHKKGESVHIKDDWTPVGLQIL